MSRLTLSALRDAAVFVVCLACAFAAASIDDPAPAVALAPCRAGCAEPAAEALAPCSAGCAEPAAEATCRGIEDAAPHNEPTLLSLLRARVAF